MAGRPPSPLLTSTSSTFLAKRDFDPVLAAQYLIPPPFDTSVDDGLNWDQVMARHIAIMG